MNKEQILKCCTENSRYIHPLPEYVLVLDNEIITCFDFKFNVVYTYDDVGSRNWIITDTTWDNIFVFKKMV